MNHFVVVLQTLTEISLYWSKLKAFADDKLKVTDGLKFVLGRVENIVGKGEKAGCMLKSSNICICNEISESLKDCEHD